MRREGDPVVALFVDLDDFKVINDSMGHDAGNALLGEVAERLRDSVRPGDTIGRIFGDEFAILLEAPAGVEEAWRVAERINECLRKSFTLRGREVHLSSSIGIALGESDKDRPEEVLRHADLAMYAAKSRGKNQHQVYDPGMEERAAKRMELESDLRRAIERKELKVYYQPKVLLEANRNRIASVEALVRWEHPKRGLLLPREFIPLAEETSLIAPLGRWVLEKACQQARRWQEQYPGDPLLVVCVNLSAKQFRLSNLQEEVAQVLRATGLQARCLHLEITEGIAMEDVESTVAMLRQLRDLGVLLTVDDFGMGYSSLSYLDRFPVDILKVARPFVAQLTGNPESMPLISAIINLAHALNLTTIAEGVENAQQLAALKEMGCEMAQGYYFTEPLPPEEVGELLARGVLP
jgi:diguanylate cyclase (GGDEF)-like protein